MRKGAAFTAIAMLALGLVSIVLILSATSFLAVWVPARRAARVDAMVALRAQ